MYNGKLYVIKMVYSVLYTVQAKMVFFNNDSTVLYLQLVLLSKPKQPNLIPNFTIPKKRV